MRARHRFEGLGSLRCHSSIGAVAAIVLLLGLAAAKPWAGRPESFEAQQRGPRLLIECDVDEVELGAPFDLTVVRSWSDDLEPESWSDSQLAPLVLVTLDSSRTERDGRFEERLRFRAHAFERQSLEIAASFRAFPRAGGEAQTAVAPPFRLRTRSALATPDAGEVELPRAPFPAPIPWLAWISRAGAVLAGALALGLIFRWRATRRGADGAPLVEPQVRAVERWGVLQQWTPKSADEAEAWTLEANDLIRSLLEARFEVPALEWTAEQLLRSPALIAGLSDEVRTRLAEFFRDLEEVRFGGSQLGELELQSFLERIEGLIQDTKAPAAAERLAS